MCSGTTLASRGAGFLNDQTRFIGVPRFRQIRSRDLDCDVPATFKSMMGVCFDNVDPSRTSVSSEETERWGPDGQFVWQSEEELDGVAFWGQAEWYSGSGYVVLLPPLNSKDSTNGTAALKLFNDLQALGWIDAKTRAVFVEMNLYNANANHFAVVTLLVEFPPVGGTIVSSDFSLHKLKRYMSSGDRIVMLFEWLFLLFGLLYFLLEISQIRRERWRYFSSGYNILDTILCVLMFAIIYLHTYCLMLEQSVDWYTTTDYVPLTKLSYYLNLQTNLYSILILVAWAKLLQYCSVFQKLSRLTVMIEMMVEKMSSFLVLLFLSFAAFATATYVA